MTDERRRTGAPGGPDEALPSIDADLSRVDWDEARVVFERAPLGLREPDVLRRSFEASGLVRLAWHRGRLVGLLRGVTDGICQAALYDFCLLPEYQGTGLGGRMLASIMTECVGMTVVLFATPGKEGFYAREGFEVLLTGMARFADPQRMRALGFLAGAD